MSNGQHQALFQPDLLQGESIQWSGQPDPSINLSKGDVFLIPFSLFFLGFSVFWLEGVVSATSANPEKMGGAIIFFYLVGSVFAIFGFYLAFGRFIYKKWKKSKTYYALTNKRALILTLTFGRKLDGAFLDRLVAINKSVRSGGSGTLYFGNPSWMTTAYGNSGMDFFTGFYSGDVPSFYDIHDADSVYDLANRLR